MGNVYTSLRGLDDEAAAHVVAPKFVNRMVSVGYSDVLAVATDSISALHFHLPVSVEACLHRHRSMIAPQKAPSLNPIVTFRDSCVRVSLPGAGQ
jgi:hypothetical protein